MDHLNSFLTNSVVCSSFVPRHMLFTSRNTVQIRETVSVWTKMIDISLWIDYLWFSIKSEKFGYIPEFGFDQTRFCRGYENVSFYSLYVSWKWNKKLIPFVSIPFSTQYCYQLNARSYVCTIKWKCRACLLYINYAIDS